MNKLASFLCIIVLAACHKESATNLIYRSDFSAYDGTWRTGCDSYLCINYGDGNYQFQVLKPNLAFSMFPQNVWLKGTFSVSVDVAITLSDLTKWGAAGINFNHISSTDYMKFYISTNGYYQVYHFGGGAITKLVDWTPSSAIKTASGVYNTLKINQRSDAAEFFINGQSVGVYSSNQCPDFNVGVTVESSSDLTIVTGVFDNFVITRL